MNNSSFFTDISASLMLSGKDNNDSTAEEFKKQSTFLKQTEQ